MEPSKRIYPHSKQAILFISLTVQVQYYGMAVLKQDLYEWQGMLNVVLHRTGLFNIVVAQEQLFKNIHIN